MPYPADVGRNLAIHQRVTTCNTKYIFFRPFESRNFTQGDRKPSMNQDLFVIPMYWAGNLTASSRQRHFVIIA